MMKKKIELILTQAWQKQSLWLNLLQPLAKMYELGSLYHKKRYQQGKRAIYKASVPVLVIGNITVGGSGKTPLIIALVKYLHHRGVCVGVISRGYGRRHGEAMLVTPSSTPKEAGDEPCLLAQSLASEVAAVAVGANRQQAIECLLKNHPNIRLIISDDGLQHHALYHDEAWIVVDVDRGFGNGKLLPQGFLREPISRLQSANVIYHYQNGADARASCHFATMYLQPDKLVAIDINNQSQSVPPKAGQAVYALTGIGYPKRFFETLIKLGFVVHKQARPDHHAFVVADIAQLQDLPIVVTAKDAVKICALINADNRHLFNHVWVLPVTAVLSQGVIQMAETLGRRFGLIAPEE